MSSNKIGNLKSTIDEFKSLLNDSNPSKDFEKWQDFIKKSELTTKNIEENIDNILDEIKKEKESQKKIKELKDEFDIIKNKFNQKIDEIKTTYNQNSLSEKKLAEIEKKTGNGNTELDSNQELDTEEKMLNAILNNVKQTDQNLKNIGQELSLQVEAVNRIQEKINKMVETNEKKE